MFAISMNAIANTIEGREVFMQVGYATHGIFSNRPSSRRGSSFKTDTFRRLMTMSGGQTYYVREPSCWGDWREARWGDRGQEGSG